MSDNSQFATMQGEVAAMAATQPRMFEGGAFRIQCHWQDPKYFQQTLFIAQGEFDSSHGGVERAMEWATDTFTARKAERPEGWLPMICTEDSKCFVQMAPAT